MPELDLKSEDGLRRACEEAEVRMDEAPHAERLRARVDLLRRVQETPPQQRASEEFLRLVSFDTTLGTNLPPDSHVGGMSRAIADEAFRDWFALQIAVALPAREEQAARVEALEKTCLEFLDRAKSFVGHKPRIIVHTVLSALFPEDLVFLPRQDDLFPLLRHGMALKGHSRDERAVAANASIRARLEEVLGRPRTLDAICRRQYLPLLLLEQMKKDDRPPKGVPNDERDPKTVLNGTPAGTWKPFGDVWRAFRQSVARQGLIFDRADVESLHLGLWADEQRHFAVLAGLSGTGKTQLGLHYGRALVGDDAESRLLPVSVQPDWHDPTPLLGYSNPLAGGAYQRTKFLNFLLRASERPAEPHVCILDEMNLSHPEQYLAPLLSAMEQPGGKVELHSGRAGKGDETSEDGSVREDARVPQRLTYPPNLVLIGTVNMDETTMGLSDKVLDRAFTLEFWDIEVGEWPGWKTCKLAPRDRGRTERVLSDLMSALQPARLHFGWRVIAEIVHFLEARGREGGGLALDDAMDRVIYAKVLPKLRGDDSPRFGDALGRCIDVLEAEYLKRSARKVRELDEDRKAIGSFRFWR